MSDLPVPAAPIDHSARAQVTVVIPAFNEAADIGPVLDTLRATEDLAAIIIVDDGSTDGTARVARRRMAGDERMRLICRWPDGGKGAALVSGAELAPTDIVLFLDADLVGLLPDHIRRLAEPVIAGRADMAIARFRRGRLWTDLSHIITPAVSGQRCLRWSQFRGAAGLREAGYGAEMVLQQHALAHGLRRQHVIWPGVTHVTKEEKCGRLEGFRQRLVCDWQMGTWYARSLWGRWLPRRFHRGSER